MLQVVPTAWSAFPGGIGGSELRRIGRSTKNISAISSPAKGIARYRRPFCFSI